MPNIPAVAPNSYDLPLSAGPNYPLYGPLYFYTSDLASSFSAGGEIHNVLGLYSPSAPSQQRPGATPAVSVGSGLLYPNTSTYPGSACLDWAACNLIDPSTNVTMSWGIPSTVQFFGYLIVPSTDTFAINFNPSYAVPGQIWYSPSGTSFQTGLARDYPTGTYAVGIIPQNILVFTGSDAENFYQDAEVSTLQPLNPGIGSITLPPNYLNAPNKLLGIDAELTTVLWSTGSTNYALWLIVTNDPTFQGREFTLSTQIFSNSMISTSTSYSFIVDGRIGFSNRGSTAVMQTGFVTTAASTILKSPVSTESVTQIPPIVYENVLSTIDLTQPVTIALASQFTGRSGSASTANAAQMVTRFITFRSES